MSTSIKTISENNINETATQVSRKRLVSVQEFAEMISVKATTVYNLVHDRRIPCVKLGAYGCQKARVLIPVEHAFAEITRLYGRDVRRPY
jgi:excisionase family DNA binding protein